MGRCDDRPVDADTFWGIIAAARAHSRLGKRFGQMATFHKEKILRYHQWLGRLHAALYRWDVWAAFISSEAAAPTMPSPTSGLGSSPRAATGMRKWQLPR